MKSFQECRNTSPEEAAIIMNKMNAQNALYYIKTNKLDTTKHLLIKNINYLTDAEYIPENFFYDKKSARINIIERNLNGDIKKI